ncbi:MAG TPA: hypothetical protein VF060_32580 [Trebonia sp.]
MPLILAIIVIAFAVLALLAFAAHFVFSPWLLVAAVVVLVWFKLRPRRFHR